MATSACGTCGGSGRTPKGRKACRACGGTGQVERPTCPACGSEDVREAEPPVAIVDGMTRFLRTQLVCGKCGVGLNREATAYARGRWRGKGHGPYRDDDGPDSMRAQGATKGDQQ